MKILPILLIGAFFVSGCNIPLGKSTKEMYIFPQDFKGPAVVVFDVQSGAAGGWGGWRGETRYFTVGDDGICITDNVKTMSAFPEFYYEDSGGNLTRIVRHDYYSYPTFSDGYPDNTPPTTTQVYGWNKSGMVAEKTCKYKYFGLYLGSSEEIKTIDIASQTKALHDSVRARICK